MPPNQLKKLQGLTSCLRVGQVGEVNQRSRPYNYDPTLRISAPRGHDMAIIRALVGILLLATAVAVPAEYLLFGPASP